MKIHLISIGGAVMHNIALDLKANGHQVSGSDDEIFEPSLSRLKNAGLLPEKQGWQPEKIDASLDLIILGMHARKDNPELIKARELGIQVMSFPEYVYHHSKDKTRVVVAGSHGKTTTTAMIMHVLKAMGRNFDYLVGSQLSGFERMVRLSDAPLIIIEGDEYLTSPVDRRPKFHWYKPHIAQITGVAWDHINVFPDYRDYVHQFELFIKDVSDALVWFEEDAELLELTLKAKCKSVAYGTPVYKKTAQTISIVHDGQDYPLQIFGKHNLQNLNGAMLVCAEIGISNGEFLRHMATFMGTARRLEPIPSSKFYGVFRDFAHAPSKVKATTEAVKEQYPNQEVCAIFELHTFSSLRKEFLPQYAGSMNAADVKAIYLNPHVFEMKNLPLLEDEELKQAFGQDVTIIRDKETLQNFVSKRASVETVLLMMSSGNFDGFDLSKLT